MNMHKFYYTYSPNRRGTNGKGLMGTKVTILVLYIVLYKHIQTLIILVIISVMVLVIILVMSN